MVLAHDHDEAVKGLRALADGKPSPLVLAADGPVTNGPVWVLAGFGAQHRKMGKSLYLRDEIFAEWINKVDALVQDERGYLRRRADPRRLAGLRHRDRDPDVAIFAHPGRAR